MILTKHQAKRLRYLARANYGATYTTSTANNSKVKHREFPCFDLAYDETMVSKDSVEITNICIEGINFDGNYDQLLERMHQVGVAETHKDNETNGCPDSLETIVNEETAVKPSVIEQGTTSNQVDAVDTAIVAEDTPTASADAQPTKAFTRAELNGLRIKFATMRVASMYGEPLDSTIDVIVRKYPDAVDALNKLYSQDGIKPYTISEEALKSAYPNEYGLFQASTNT